MGKYRKNKGKEKAVLSPPVKSRSRKPATFLLLIGGLSVGFALVGWLVSSPKMAEFVRTPVDLQPPYMVEQNGQPLMMNHLMGYSPLTVEFNAPNGEKIQFNDDIIYRKVEEMVNMLSGPYREQWDQYLRQTTLSGRDPQRNFFVMVSGPDYPGITDHPQSGVAAAAFAFANHGQSLEVWIDGEVLAGWQYLSYEDQVFTASSLLHEFRHLNDHLKHPEFDQLQKKGHDAIIWSKKIPHLAATKDKLLVEWEYGKSIDILKEMLAYNDQFTWIVANSSKLAKQLGERPTPEIQPIYLAWKTGDVPKFAAAVAEGYKVDIGMDDLTPDLWKLVKQDIVKWAAEDFEKIRQSEHSATTAK